MILLASSQEIVVSWRQILAPCFEIYPQDLHDLQPLELCLKKHAFDVLMVDLALLGEQGLDKIFVLKSLAPALHIIVMTQTPDSHEEIAALLFGARAYCGFNTPASVLLEVVNTVLKNELWVDRTFVSRLLSELKAHTLIKHQDAQKLMQGMSSLTKREREIASHIACGETNREIALQLQISERTVKAHLSIIFKKLNIHDRLKLALYVNHYQQLAAFWR